MTAYEQFEYGRFDVEFYGESSVAHDMTELSCVQKFNIKTSKNQYSRLSEKISTFSWVSIYVLSYE